MKAVILACVSLIISFASTTDPFENAIKWIPGSFQITIQMQLDPVGKMRNKDVFLCRVNIDGNSIPGKLFSHRGNIRCSVPNETLEYKSNSFELLYSHPGTTTWRRYDGSINENTITGGQMHGEKTFICRTYHQKNLIPGMLDVANKTCNVAENGLAYAKDDIVEVLVRNALGEVMRTEIIQT